MPPRAAVRHRPAPGQAKRGADGHIAYLLRQAHAAVRSALDSAFIGLGLTTPQFLILNLLDAYPDASGAELARIALLTPQTVNLIVRKLERDHLIRRCEHETHGRVLRLQLTTEGRRRLQACKRQADEVEGRLLALLDGATERKVRAWLSALAEAELDERPLDGPGAG